MRRISMPEGRGKAIKQFTLQILNTALAVIIALSFEGLVEWRRIRELVATARAHMRSEILDNRKDLSAAVKTLTDIESDRAAFLKFVDAVLAARLAGTSRDELPQGKIGLRRLGLVLNATSRQTAEATGALGHMEYSEVKRYAEAYSMQEEFMRIRQRMAEDQTRVHALLRTNLMTGPEPEVRELRSALQAFQESIREMSHYGQLLLKFYDGALEAAGTG